MTRPPSYPQDPPAYTPRPPWLHQQPPIYEPLPPDDPPPSYDDATHSETAPLLVGTAEDYGTNQHDAQSSTSTSGSDMDLEETSIAEYVGQAVAVLMFCIAMYGFWQIATHPADFFGEFPP